MKECKRISSLYGEIHEQRLDSVAHDNVLEHFRNCTDCREDFKWYGITVKALNNLEEVSPPADFVSQLSTKLYTQQDSRVSESYVGFFKNLFSSSPYLPLPVGAASLAFLVVVGFVVYNQAPVPEFLSTPPTQAAKDPGPMRTAAAISAVDDQRGMQRTDYHLPGTVIPHNGNTTFTAPTAPKSFPLAAIPKSIGTTANYSGRYLNTRADRIGADNLTVESPSVDLAIESVKRILPDIKGKLVEENDHDGIGEKMIGIRIPSRAYANLTRELVNHGAVAAGAGSDAKAPAPAKADANSVVLYIRFIPSH
jgi:hypothetical protein